MGIKDVRADCFCASLLRTKFTSYVMHRARALSSKVNNNRANGHCYDFAWWPLCFFRWVMGSCDGSFSLPIFYVLRKNEQNLSSRSLNILQNAPTNFIHLTSSFSCASVSNSSLMVMVCENDGNISKTKPVSTNFYFISETSKSLSVRSKSLKKILSSRTFSRRGKTM